VFGSDDEECNDVTNGFQICLINPLFKKAVLAKSAFLSDPLFAIHFLKCKSASQRQRQPNSTFDERTKQTTPK
jgi:hypothetical protein